MTAIAFNFNYCSKLGDFAAAGYDFSRNIESVMASVRIQLMIIYMKIKKKIFILLLRVKGLFDNAIVDYLVQNCYICPTYGAIKLNDVGIGNHITQIRERMAAVFGIENVDYKLICAASDKLCL